MVYLWHAPGSLDLAAILEPRYLMLMTTLPQHGSCTQAADSLSRFAQRETPVDNRSDCSALDEPCQDHESFRVAFGDERDDPPVESPP